MLMVALAVTFGAVMFCVSALQTLPAYEYGSLAKRWVSLEDPIGWNDKVPYMVHQMFSSGPLSVLGILFPALSRNAESYTGIVAFSLAMAGFFARRRKIAVADDDSLDRRHSMSPRRYSRTPRFSRIFLMRRSLNAAATSTPL